MRAQMEFSEMLADLKSPSSKLEDAIDEILGCKTLTQLFLVILNAGNILNAVSSLPSPYSFFISYCFSTREPVVVRLMVSKLNHSES